MHTVYVLYSETHDKIYIGYTSDLAARFASHNKLSSKGWTKRYRPRKVIYTEKFELKKDAMKRERQLKSCQGRTFIRDLIVKGR